jgi:hypothetical protein
MALGGKRGEAFYMVGRMEGRSVGLRAEKGMPDLLVDKEESGGKQERDYDFTVKEKERGGREGEDGKG